MAVYNLFCGYGAGRVELAFGVFVGGKIESPVTSYRNNDKYFYATNAVTAGSALPTSAVTTSGKGTSNYNLLIAAFNGLPHKYTYSTDTWVVGTAFPALPSAIDAAIGNPDLAIFATGGTAVGRYTYATDATAVSGAGALTYSAAYASRGAVGTSSFGLFAGGFLTGTTSTAQSCKYNYINGSAVASTSLPYETTNPACFGTPGTGYIVSGCSVYQTIPVSTFVKYNYSADTVATTTPGLNIETWNGAGNGNSTKGIVGGGMATRASPYTSLATVKVYTYPSDTITPGTNLSVARHSLTSGGSSPASF